MSDQTLVLRGGEVFDPAGGRRGAYDVAFDGDRVTDIAPNLSGQHVVDVSGCLVVPGLIDLHSHVFEGIGEGVNAENIAGCIELLKNTKWDGVLSIECEAAPGNVEKSIDWLRKEIAR